MLDLEYLAAVLLLVIDHHVKLASRKLQFEHTMVFIGGLHSFQQDDIFHHPATDFFQNSFGDLRLLPLAVGCKGFILHQHMDKGLCLAVPHPRLGEQDVFHRFCVRIGCLNGAVHDQLQRSQIFLDLVDMGLRNADGLLLPVADVQQLHQPAGDRLSINGIQHIRALLEITLFPQVCGSEPQIVGGEILRQYRDQETVVHILDDPIDGAGQLPGLV